MKFSLHDIDFSGLRPSNQELEQESGSSPCWSLTEQVSGDVQ